jgi:hypothetical protein
MTEHTTPQSADTLVLVSERDLTSPIAHAVADGYNPKYGTGAELDTDYRRKVRVRHNEHTAREVNAANSELTGAINRVEAVAQVRDPRVTLESVKNDLGQLFDQVGSEHPKYVDNEKTANERAEEFRVRENRPIPPDNSYAVNPDWPALTSSTLAVIITEALVIAAYIAPYAPGGMMQAFSLAMMGGVSIGGLALAFGAFALRAFYYSSPWLRGLARVTTFLAPLAAKAMLAYTAAFRTHLQTGKPIGEWLHYVSPDVGFFFAVSIGIFIVTALKARGGHGLPWTPYYGEASADRAPRIARSRREASEQHWHNQTAELLSSASDQNRQSLMDEEERLASVQIDAETAIGSIARHLQRAQDYTAETKADLRNYESTFAQVRPDVTFKKTAIVTPPFPNAAYTLTSALGRARGRLALCRNAAAELDGLLAQIREEAVQNLNQTFLQMRAN